MKVKLYPGNGMHKKHYTSYFPKLQLEIADPSASAKQRDIILCHSKGIEKAMEDLKNGTAHVVIAMDPSYFPADQERVYIWCRKGRDDIPEKRMPHIIVYEEQTHKPYQVKRIRDQIQNFILEYKRNEIKMVTE